MSLLDFIKNRKTQQQSAAPQPRSETAKQMYTREAGQERPGYKLEDRMPTEQLGKAKEAKQVGITGGQDVSEGNAPAPSPTPSGGATNPQPMRQMSMQQDNSAPALSPTTAQMGTPGRDQDSPSPTPPSTPKPTLPRTTPSWER